MMSWEDNEMVIENRSRGCKLFSISYHMASDTKILIQIPIETKIKTILRQKGAAK